MLVENEMCACDISDRLSIGQSTVSHHMKQLVDSSLISMRKEGKWVIYTLNHEVLYKSSDFFIDLISQDVSKVVSCPCDDDQIATS
jgi:ArsR family transcriptional regulator